METIASPTAARESQAPSVGKKSPLVVMTAAPMAGHFAPPALLARELIKRGYEIVFMTSPDFKDQVEKIGCEYYETTPFHPPGTAEGRLKLPIGPPRTFYDIANIFIASFKPRSDSLRSLLEMVHERDPKRPIVIVAERMSMGVVPFMYGAPLPAGFARFPKTIGLNVIPLSLTSVDTAPFGLGLPPDSTESGRARNKLIYQMMSMGPLAPLIKLSMDTMAKVCGCTSIPEGIDPIDMWYVSYDTMFQMCSPSLEYPRSDLDPSIRFAGALPKRGIDANFQYPSWWSEIKRNKLLPEPERKRVIPIAQGTVATDYNELIIPTIKALADRDDVIVIAILGVKGAGLQEDMAIPKNTRIADYLPYDAALEYADVFVTNGGYGSMMHAVINGVPMVVAGQTEDKTEVTARVEYSGLGINLKTQLPSPEQIIEGIDKVLGNASYQRTARRLMRENSDLDAITIIEKQIVEYAASS